MFDRQPHAIRKKIAKQMHRDKHYVFVNVNSRSSFASDISCHIRLSVTRSKIENQKRSWCVSMGYLLGFVQLQCSSRICAHCVCIIRFCSFEKIEGLGVNWFCIFAPSHVKNAVYH